MNLVNGLTQTNAPLERRQILGYFFCSFSKLAALVFLEYAGRLPPELFAAVDFRWVVSGAVLGLCCGAVSLKAPSWSSDDTPAVIHTDDDKATKGQLTKTGAWNPYIAFGGGGGPRKLFCHGLVFSRLILSTCLSPVDEALWFRSFLYRRLAVPWESPGAPFTDFPLTQFSPVAFALVSLCFASQYLRFRYEWVPGLLVAVASQALVLQTGSLVAAIAVHAAYNLVVGTSVVYTGNWSAW
mmetsp:Transcript_28834/g.62263  ORF Transcript_28834/g.62263 Transcript_28834/m.62263 type:complete len:240 (+) Transcript_28834:1-720(+)